MERDLPLIPTHVAGLDAALGGGIPAGAIVLVAGTPGTMKSSLIYNMMYHNAKAGRRGLYITLEQTTESLRMAMERMGYDPIDEGKLYVLDLGVLRTSLKKAEATKDWVGILVDIVREAVSANGYEILALDSMEALYALANFEVPRRGLVSRYPAPRERGASTLRVAGGPRVEAPAGAAVRTGTALRGRAWRGSPDGRSSATRGDTRPPGGRRESRRAGLRGPPPSGSPEASDRSGS